jgi:hypothetical protein
MQGEVKIKGDKPRWSKRDGVEHDLTLRISRRSEDHQAEVVQTWPSTTYRPVLQANTFGAWLPVATQVTGLTSETTYAVLQLYGRENGAAKCLLIATGADYRMLEVPGCEAYEGRGVLHPVAASTRSQGPIFTPLSGSLQTASQASS